MNHTQSQSKTFKRTTSLELSRWYMGIVLTNLEQKKDSNGAFSLLEATLVPGNEPPPHVHTREDELFYVLEGDFDVYVGEEAFNVSASECIFLPKFRPHALVIRSPRLRVLILYTPGGLEEAFNKMSSPAQNLEPPTEALTYSQSDLEQTARRFAEYGVQMLTPEEVAEQLPLYPKPLPRSGKADLIERAG
jgi:mannose-6-phosphate isomerase-like protein (cupin superfamily)